MRYLDNNGIFERPGLLNPYWQSGDGLSSLYQGDALDVMATIQDNSIDCVWTDPPYFLSNDGITCVAGRMVKVNKGEWDRSNGLDSDTSSTCAGLPSATGFSSQPVLSGSRGRFTYT